MKFRFGTRSERNLTGVHPDIVRVCRRALSYGIMDFSVICGIRTYEEQKRLYAQGRTEPGEIVTWTMNSRHLPQEDGYSHAVDLAPYPIDWGNEDRFWMLRGIMMAAAREEGVDLEYLPSGRDLPHFQLRR
jgi:peptidoglycan LD-endopeptidase CwlK